MYKYQIKLKILNKIPKLKINQTNKFITQILFELLIANRPTLFNLLTKFVITTLSTLCSVERKKGEGMVIFISLQQFSKLKTFSSSFFLFFSKLKNHIWYKTRLIVRKLESWSVEWKSGRNFRYLQRFKLPKIQRSPFVLLWSEILKP